MKFLKINDDQYVPVDKITSIQVIGPLTRDNGEVYEVQVQTQDEWFGATETENQQEARIFARNLVAMLEAGDD